jgi:hypothetical protein
MKDGKARTSMPAKHKTAPFTFAKLKRLALSLKLPSVTEAASWGQPCLKAHGKLWVWWSPHEQAPVFKIPREERDMLIELDPERFYVTPHYAPHALVLVRPHKLDEDWARMMLLRTWREMAPKRVLKAYDEKNKVTA